ncbi:hypothetical protein JCM19000A_25670 [Silvimonas sp. JCM 19000]
MNILLSPARCVAIQALLVLAVLASLNWIHETQTGWMQAPYILAVYAVAAIVQQKFWRAAWNALDSEEEITHD